MHRAARRTIDIDDSTASRLRRLNVAAAILHLTSAAAMVVAGNDFSIDVTTFDLGGPPGTDVADGNLTTVVGVPLAWGTAGFLALSALFHAVVASPGAFDRYLDELRHGRNRFRWVEYSLSATLMIVLIALVTGVLGFAALVGIAFANVAMILFGWLMEVANPPGRDRTWWTPFWFGCVAGIGPWLAIFGTIAINVADGSEGPPGFVYGILVTIFVLFNCFAVVQWLQFRGRGRWVDHLVGERAYIVLSFLAKSALAWQIFANTLID